ncbi:substrate-binding periplasmic protein [Faucicola atlantae]|uniref:substrate-binding periplasmic protein n=1 Tax=Faucicola atlantae TaxID=34059 RepID=UPI0025B11959|nr:transporter substrate-binding domain-containing protein [Moraxella atlantae]
MKRWAGLGMFVCGAMLSACTQSNVSNNQDAAAGAASAPTGDSFVSKLPANAPVVKVATTGTMPPFSILDQYGNLTGYDVDVIRAIGEEEGFRVEFVKEPFSGLFNSVDSGKTDLLISGVSYKPERAERYALSDPYFFNPSAIMYKDNNLNIQRFEDLKGLHVGAMDGTIQYEKIKDANIARELTATRSTYLLFQQLVQGNVDAILQDYPLLKETANSHPEQKVKIVPYQDQSDPTSQQVIVMKKGNNALQAKINDGIRKIKADGTLKKIDDKWNISVEQNVATPAATATP